MRNNGGGHANHSSDCAETSPDDTYTEGGTGDENSGAYESPPQGEPDVQAPPPTPTPAPTPTPSPQGGGVQTP